MNEDPYVYPGTSILKNKLGLTDGHALEVFERQITAARAMEGVPAGDFDLGHLRAIHRHLFQDVYEWAGELRTVEISKGGNQFMFRQFIDNGMADVHRRLVAGDYLRGLSAKDFAREAGIIIGDVNYVHPFREGNGRTQLLYLQQLTRQAGHELSVPELQRSDWVDASRQAHLGNYDNMSGAIFQALQVGPRSHVEPSTSSDYIADLLTRAGSAAHDSHDDAARSPNDPISGNHPGGRAR